MTGKAMEQRISMITLGVESLERARAFYDGLGWQAASGKEENIIAYNLPDMVLALYPLEKFFSETNCRITKGTYSSVLLSYNVMSKEAVKETLGKVVEAGGQLIKPSAETFWGGFSGYFSDPDGTLWEVAFNPFSPLLEGGGFQWS